MGGLTTALAPIIQIGSALSGVAKVGQIFASNSVNKSQAQATDRLNQQQAAQDAALQRQRNQLDLLNTEADRKLALKRAVARQRAAYGGQGLGLEDGSSEAVLLGMFDDSGLDGAYNRQKAGLQDQALSLSQSQLQQKNLLAQSQLQEKQNLKYLTDTF